MKLSGVWAVLGCWVVLMSAGAVADDVSLKAPSTSVDGSFVLRVESSLDTHESSKKHLKLEIYRNKDGGEYSRILLAPHFSALSELVRENGRYGYKARWVNEYAQASQFSAPIFIDVETTVPMVVKPRNDAVASTGSSVSNVF